MPATTKKISSNNSTTGKRLPNKQYRVTFFCRAKGANTLTTVENVKTSFKCPICETTLIYLANEHKLGAHGKSVDSKEHELRKVQEQEIA
jgi:transcription initiation factor IIE alpha subunit